ncbi:MAG: hypothetical protein CMB77_04635 [Euryarchaeota archaeon]|nr:hypothetical protein [Euryarchaeota archaeon]|tara:strand:+ start:3263 stop:3529 length:267 start_codon:yes stop_codon:yes gene_type:complete
MKITKRKLRSIIRESLLLEYEQYVYRTKTGQLRIKDDDGNDEPAEHMEDQYGYLKNGEGEVILGTGGGRYNYNSWDGYRPTRGRGRRR